MADQTTKSIIVGAPVADVFAAWADFENFPRFMEDIKSVTRTGEKTTRWVARGPMGQDVEWEAETTRFEPNKRIAWRSTDDSPVTTSGQVTFKDRKSTRLNSSHVASSYAVFCLKKKKLILNTFIFGVIILIRNTLKLAFSS